MEQLDQLDELLTCRLDYGRKAVEPCSIVIFGASGDLTARKLIPALFHLFCEKQLPTPFRIIGFARREKSDASWRDELKADLEKFSRTKPVDDAQWKLSRKMSLIARANSPTWRPTKSWKSNSPRLDNEQLRRNLLFYLSTSPSQFAEVVEHLHNAELLHREEKNNSGSASWWKNRSGTTSLRRSNSTRS